MSIKYILNAFNVFGSKISALKVLSNLHYNFIRQVSFLSLITSERNDAQVNKVTKSHSLWALCQDLKLNLITKYNYLISMLYCFLFNICHLFPQPVQILFSLCCLPYKMNDHICVERESCPCCRQQIQIILHFLQSPFMFSSLLLYR